MPSFAQALVLETLESERLRVRLLAATLATLLVAILVLMALVPDTVRAVSAGRMRPWIPIAIFGPFILYDWAVSLLLSRFIARRREPPMAARLAGRAELDPGERVELPRQRGAGRRPATVCPAGRDPGDA
jgi:hypothetical protein